MNLVKELLKGLLPEEDKKQTTAVYAGGFKPPTSGHFEVVKQALEENPEIDEFIIFIGNKERNGISQDESLLIWEIYNNYLPFKVKIEPTSIPPIKAVYDFAKNHPTREVLWVIGAREGNEEDFKDITSRTSSISKYPNLELRTIITAGGVSGTAARNAAKISLDKFAKFVPDQLSDEETEEVFNIVADKIQEIQTPAKEKDVDPKELEMGIKIEMEHTDDPTKAKLIALQHLAEDPKYYTKLASLGLEENKQITYTNPNFDTEWEEANRYPEFVEMGKEEWVKLAKQGKSVPYSSIKKVLGNVNLDFDSLEEPKKQRFTSAFKDGNIETPIAVKFSDNDYDLVAGNTRLAGSVKNGIDPKIWVVDISDLQENYTDGKITEAKQVGNLYHYTSAEGLKGILQSNTLRASEEEYLGNELYYISFTRNKNFHKKGHSFNVRTDYRITLDGDKLSNKYKIKPFAYKPGWNYEYSWEFDWLEDEPESVARDFFDGTGDYDEQEERISFKDSNGSIPNIKNYILKVDKVSDLQENYADGKVKGKSTLNENASYSQHINVKQRIKELTKHMLDKGMNIQPLPKVIFKNGDDKNAKQFLGKTAYYDPNNQSIVLYTEGRHPKDIVRSFAHEMIHHIQNLEGRLGDINTTNTLEDGHLDKLEQEANLGGTMTFRNWTDSLTENKKEDKLGIEAFSQELARLREEEGEYKIYLDMDGVVADFDQRFRSLSGMEPNEFEDTFGKNKFWDFIDEEHKLRFWIGIPVMEGAKELVDYVSKHDYVMLTAPSSKKESRLGKLLWVRNHTGDVFPSKPQVIFKKAKEKHQVKPQLTNFDILIDDRQSTIDNWNNAGGTGILYQSASQVISDLQKLGL